MQARDILLGDLQYIRSELARNEEIGEKRFGFFVTLVTAVCGGLVALWTNKNGHKIPDEVAPWSLFALLVFGLLTYLRLWHRNRVTDQLKDMTKDVRSWAVTLCNELGEDHDLHWPGKTGFAKWLRAGYTEVVGLINGALLGVFLALMFDMKPGIATVYGVALVAILWIPSVRRGKNRASMVLAGQFFRAGVGAIIRRPDGDVLAFERSDVSGSWQLPQGGLEPEEEPIDAVRREISEETGIQSEDLSLIDQFPEPLAYELPPTARSSKTGRGQTQYWFLFQVESGVEVNLPSGGEFCDWKWVRFDDLVSTIVTFRKPLYERLAKWLLAH